MVLEREEHLRFSVHGIDARVDVLRMQASVHEHGAAELQRHGVGRKEPPRTYAARLQHVPAYVRPRLDSWILGVTAQQEGCKQTRVSGFSLLRRT